MIQEIKEKLQTLNKSELKEIKREIIRLEFLNHNMVFCHSSDFINIQDSFYYLKKDNSIYAKIKGQNFKFIYKLKNKPKIEILNKEFMHQKVILNDEIKTILNNLKFKIVN